MNRNDYRRALVMLRSLKGGISGYVRLERRTLMGILHFTVNGAPAGGELHAVLLYRSGNGWTAIKAGTLGEPRYGQAGLVWKFDPRNIDGKPLEDYELTAVIEIKNGVCEVLLCGNLNGTVETDWMQVRDAACRLFSPVRISAPPIPSICSAEDIPVEPEQDQPQILPDFSEESPAYPGEENQPILPKSPVSGEEPDESFYETDEDEQNALSVPSREDATDRQEKQASETSQQENHTDDMTGIAGTETEEPTNETSSESDSWNEDNATANQEEEASLIPFVLPDAEWEKDEIDTPAVDRDEFDSPALNQEDADEFDAPATNENYYSIPARHSKSSSPAEMPENDSFDVPAADEMPDMPKTAGDLLELNDPDLIWPEAVEPLRRLFYTSEAIVPFETDGYVFIRAPLPEETGCSSCLIGLRCEKGSLSQVCYAIPALYSPEPPAGLEGYEWRGDRVRGYWIARETLE